MREMMEWKQEQLKKVRSNLKKKNAELKGIKKEYKDQQNNYHNFIDRIHENFSIIADRFIGLLPVYASNQIDNIEGFKLKLIFALEELMKNAEKRPG